MDQPQIGTKAELQLSTIQVLFDYRAVRHNILEFCARVLAIFPSEWSVFCPFLVKIGCR
jgi:hypothetical protein